AGPPPGGPAAGRPRRHAQSGLTVTRSGAQLAPTAPVVHWAGGLLATHTARVYHGPHWAAFIRRAPAPGLMHPAHRTGAPLTLTRSSPQAHNVDHVCPGHSASGSGLT